MSNASPPENPWLSIGFNLLIPILLLSKGADWLSFLPPWGVLIVALAFPVGYFGYDFAKRRKINGFSIIGFISVILTGGIGLLQLSPMVFAIKETALPLIFGLAVVGSQWIKRPLVKLMFFNPSVVDTEKVTAALQTPEQQSAFDALVRRCTWIFGSSFLVSAVLNFFLTRMIVTTDPKIDAVAFNQEIGKQTGITWIIITVATLPLIAVAMWQFFKGIKSLTGYGLDDVLQDQKDK